MTLEATLDGSTSYLQDFLLHIHGEQTEDDQQLSSVSINVEVDYFDHNEVDLTEIKDQVDKDLTE